MTPRTFIAPLLLALLLGCDGEPLPSTDAGSESDTGELPDTPTPAAGSLGAPAKPDPLNFCACIDPWGQAFNAFCGPNVTCADCCYEEGGKHDPWHFVPPGNQEPGDPPVPGDPPAP